MSWQGENADGRGVSLLVVDRHPVVREGLRRLLHESGRVTVVGDADSGEAAVTAARRLAPQVVLLDERLPDILCEDAVARLRSASHGTKVVIFTPCVTARGLEEARRLGVAGLLSKDAPPGRVADVVTRVAGGEVVADRVSAEALRQAACKLGSPQLTPHEHQILVRAATGATNAEIGSAMYLAPTTVKSYLQSALQKLNARNRVEAVAKLGELELL